MFGACVLTIAMASKWSISSSYSVVWHLISAVDSNVPAVRWSPLLLSQPEDKDTGERPGSLCGFYQLMGKLGGHYIYSQE